MNFCEALIKVRQTWTRCGRRPVDLHHRLTRARGGLVLDNWGERYHQMYLCREHHQVAHDQGKAFETGLLIDGYVLEDEYGAPVYTGTDPYLKEKYGSEESRSAEENVS